MWFYFGMKKKPSSAASFWLQCNPDSKLLLDDQNTMFLLLPHNAKHKPIMPFIILFISPYILNVFQFISPLIADFPALTERWIKLYWYYPDRRRLFIFFRQSVYKYYPGISEDVSTFFWNYVMAVSFIIVYFSWIHFTISSWKSPPLKRAENFKFSQYMCTIWNQYL